MELENVGGLNPEPIAGFTTTMYYALRSDFETVAEPPAFDAVGGYATKAKCVGEHVFKTGKFFNTIEIVPDTGKIETTSIGERKRKLSQNAFTAQISGSEDVVLGFMRMVKNADFVVLVQENGGNMRQFGSQLLKGWFDSLAHTGEEAVEGNNSCTFTVMDKQKWPAPIYTGDIQIAPTQP